MKKFVYVLLLFAVLTFTIPIGCVIVSQNLNGKFTLNLPKLSLTNQDENKNDNIVTPAKQTDENVILQDASTLEVFSVPLKEYLIGAVAAEMPADYSVEALKAQAVCCHSYALSLKLTNKDKPELNGAWLTVNPTAKEGYITKEIMQTLWQTDFNANYAKIQTAVDEVVNVVATFNGSPALTCYHAISAGQTENSANVWQQELPYLTGVDSTLDVTSPNFLQTQTFTPQQMYDALTVNFTGLDLTCDPANWFGEINYSTAGYATSLVLNKGVTVEGKDFRNALCLASTALEIEYADDRFVITTKGYGHGVGLSQYGANALALTGKTYSEILQHYFVGIMLSE